MTVTNPVKNKLRLFKSLALRSIAAAVIILGWMTGGLMHALDPARDITLYNIDIFTTENGLPQSSILAAVQTRDGYLWLGTYEGLARFDGIQFKVFDSSNTPQFSGNRVRALLESRDGHLWIGTSAGLLLHRGGTFRRYSTMNGLTNNYVRCIYEDRYGSIWLGTVDGLNRLDPENNRILNFSTRHGLTHTYISTLVEDMEANLYIGTLGGGLHRYTRSGRRIRPFPIAGLPANIDIQALFRDRGGRIWVGTQHHGVIILDKNRVTRYTTADGLSGNQVRAIFQDSSGSVWIGTNGFGLNVYRNSVFSSLSSPSALLDRPIRCIIEDREANLWVGTRDGLTQLKDGKFILYNQQNGLPANSVRSVFQDQAGDIWLGTVTAGLVRHRFGKFRTFGKGEGLRSLHIWSMTQGADGSIWFGTYGGGLHRLKDGKLIKVFHMGNGLANNTVRAVFAAKDGRIWAGTNGGGIDIIDPATGSIKNYNQAGFGLSDDFIYAISADKLGNTWIGTYFGKLNRVRDGYLTIFSRNSGLPGHAIWSIYPDPEAENTIWFGTDGGGLVRFKDNKFTVFTHRHGLYSNLAFQVTGDLQGNLWMNCNKGIYSVKKKDLDDVANGRLKKVSCITFGKSDGIKSTECNGPAQPAGLCTIDGKLLFPTIRGAVIISPDKIKTNTVAPPVVIEKMTVNNKTVYVYPVNKGERIRLTPGRKRLEFDFTGLSFTVPGQVTFKYKLEGFDRNWNEAGTYRRASYTNLPPGEYEFRVIAANHDGTWNNDGDRLTFSLAPLFWQTLWFKVVCVLAFAMFSYFLVHFIRKHLRLISFWEKRRTIGSYEIEEKIGVGGMGEIYKVHSMMDKTKTFAIKVMKEEHMLDELQKKRFKNESLLVDRIEHPHIVKVFERGEHEEKLYIVMELLHGQNLSQRYKSNRFPSITQTIHILKQIADVLKNLHHDNIIHRDLKPENIMLVNHDGDLDFVKLLDFGIARVQSFSSLTETGQVLGTLPYMSPEVLTDGDLSPSLDIYSLGVMAYEMLTREKPHKESKPLETIKRILHDNPVPPVQLNPAIPAWLNHLILAMIDKNNTNRPDAGEVLVALTNPPNIS